MAVEIGLVAELENRTRQGFQQVYAIAGHA